jgi:hypothetical protein
MLVSAAAELLQRLRNTPDRCLSSASSAGNRGPNRCELGDQPLSDDGSLDQMQQRNPIVSSITDANL